jgi:LPPG:FO 2-phospho-L-lactate transferase
MMDLPAKLSQLKIVAFAGGVGGAKLAHGLANVVPNENLTIIVNIGDDFDHYGLRICPDLDTVCYTLADLANPITGWGLKDESLNVLQAVEILGGPTWFKLGDRDLATHLERTRRLSLGQPLSQITADFCRIWGVRARVLPASDQRVPTLVYTQAGILPFQEYFVRQHCEPQVTGFEFADAARSKPAPGVFQSIHNADIVIFCPSNPFVSIDPILAVPGIREALQEQRQTGMVALAISPIIGGQTIKGPAAKMFSELGIQPSAFTVAEHYQELLDGFILDKVDEHWCYQINELRITPRAANTLMTTNGERSRLALECLDFGLLLKSRARSVS